MGVFFESMIRFMILELCVINFSILSKIVALVVIITYTYILKFQKGCVHIITYGLLNLLDGYIQ